MEVVASLSQGRTAAAQCGLFTYKSVPVIFEPPCVCIYIYIYIYIYTYIYIYSIKKTGTLDINLYRKHSNAENRKCKHQIIGLSKIEINR